MVGPRISQYDCAASAVESKWSDSDDESDGDGPGDGIYWLSVEESSTHTTFPMPGQVSAATLRRYLEERLPAELITDDHGIMTPIAHITEDRLPCLQAKLWLAATENIGETCDRVSTFDHKIRRGRPVFNDPNQPISRPAPLENAPTMKHGGSLAAHISFITGMLDGTSTLQLYICLLIMKAKHIFVVGDGVPRTCELRACQELLIQTAESSTVVTLEPLVHWGTVTANTYTSSSKIQIFRRDGEKWSDPLWTLAAKCFIPDHPTAYCLSCLEMLMANRADARAAMKKPYTSSFISINDFDAPSLIWKPFQTSNQDVDIDMVGLGRKLAAGVPRPTIEAAQPVEKSLSDEDSMVFCLQALLYMSFFQTQR